MTLRERIRYLVRLYAQERAWRKVLVVASTSVVLVVAMVLASDGIATTRVVRVLDCHAEGALAHVHDASCYDDGELVCPLEERVAHTHDDSCIVETRVLVCELDEFDAHEHDETCYDEEGNLTCAFDERGIHTHSDGCYAYDEDGNLVLDDEGKPVLVCTLHEGEPHRHDESCYEVTREVVCGLEETVGEHVHVDACFREVQVTDDDLDEGGVEPVEGVLSHVEDEDASGPVTSGDVSGDASGTDDGADDVADDVPAVGADSADGNEAHIVTSEVTDEAGAEDAPVISDMPEQSFDADVVDEAGSVVAHVHVHAPSGAFAPGVRMVAALVPSKGYADVLSDVVSGVADGVVSDMAVIDISFIDVTGAVVEPLREVDVTIGSDVVSGGDNPVVVHVGDAGRGDVMPSKVVDESVSFSASSFSPYAIVMTTTDVTLEATDDSGLHVEVEAPASAGVPKSAALEASVVGGGSASGDVVSAIESALGRDVRDAVLVDIAIVDGNGIKLQPRDSVEVKMSSDALDAVSLDSHVVHVHDDGTVEDMGEVAFVGSAVAFEASSFSVYGIVEFAPDIEEPDVEHVTSVSALTDDVDGRYYANLTRNGSNVYVTPNLTRDGKCLQVTGSATAAARLLFEPAGDGDASHVRIGIEGADGSVSWISRQSNANHIRLVSDVADATVFAASVNSDGRFLFKDTSGNYWLQYSNSGGGIRFYTDANNAPNSRFSVTVASSYEVRDPVSLDGATYGIACSNERTFAYGLVVDDGALSAVSAVIRQDPTDDDGRLFVAKNSDFADWTFVWSDVGGYVLSTVVDGEVRHLGSSDGGLVFVDDMDDASLFNVTVGEGAHAGMFMLDCNGQYVSVAQSGVSLVASPGDTSWLRFVVKSDLTDDDFVEYGASKVSVSDSVNVHDGSEIVMYTRVWNDVTSRYDYYVVDHDGKLVKAYDRADGIEWVGTRINTALWELGEHVDDNGDPTGYYELVNTQYGNRIEPQQAAGEVMSDGGDAYLNLYGITYGRTYTTIIVWDDDNYSYSGLRAEGDHLVPCPLDEAATFYFAVMSPVDVEDDEPSTVETIDNDTYGITMRMIDFDNTPLGSTARDPVQHGFFGGFDGYTQGLLSTDIDPATGYPTTTMLTGHEASLGELYNDMFDVNHLFVKSVYDENGYFEYDSTQNFASLVQEDGSVGSDFSVYHELAAIGSVTRPTRTHGQFMPFNTISPGVYAYDSHGDMITNQTDVLQNTLPLSDPRKGEPLYLIPQNKADYYFGMEMSAHFTQTEGGLDAWGHDIIFEFTGDDDFWLYVDGELVLDLGGVRSALPGSVNFRTGKVVNAGVETTLYDAFYDNYVSRGMSDAEATAKLDSIFVVNDDGERVFRDYTTHEMRVFYMERGAGASNLKMRFNLSAVKPGMFVLSKDLSGTDNSFNDLVEVPYQVWYRMSDEDDYQLLTERTSGAYNVLLHDTNRGVPFRATYSPDGTDETYQNVFMVKAGEAVDVRLPDGAFDYYVVECGVREDTYDGVVANGEELVGETVDTGVADYAIEPATLYERSRVSYDNHVRPGAMRSLRITKSLYDSDGETLLHHDLRDGEDPSLLDATTFDFRLALGVDADGNMMPANLYPYYVLDRDGNYCRWVAGSGFVSLGITDHDELLAYLADLSSAEREAIVFRTSQNGAISRIPADYSVEVHDLLIGTRYRVMEREDEIPRGYTLRLTDGYTRVDGGRSDSTGVVPYVGTIAASDDVEVEVRNQKGWGITVNKIWSDRDFVSAHDDTYFAVYVREANGALSADPVDGSVRVLHGNESSLYWFFDSLESTTDFSRYVVREVLVEDASGTVSVDGDGVVSVGPLTSVTPLGEGVSVEVGADYIVSGSHQRFEYRVAYEQGSDTGRNENVRIDRVYNTRPGVRIVKRSWDGEGLVGATFTIVDESLSDVAQHSYVSGEGGLVTTAYLMPGTSYVMETESAAGYAGLGVAIRVTLDADGTVHAECDDDEAVTLTRGADGMWELVVRNRRSVLRAVKVEDDGETPLAGAHFALYRGVVDGAGQVHRDYRPLAGKSDLVSGDDGRIGGIDETLARDVTYYLSETEAPEGYAPLDGDVVFTIGADGVVRLLSDAGATLSSKVVDDEMVFSLAVENSSLRDVRIRKVDVSNWQNGALSGASFELVRVDGDARIPVAGGVSGSDGIVVWGGDSVLSLPFGTYELSETEAPTGYVRLSEPVVIEVAESGVSYDDGTSLSESGDGIVVDNVTGMVTISIPNVSGFELPASGGSGMSSTLRAIGLLVVALVVAASLGLWGGLRGRHFVR